MAKVTDWQQVADATVDAVQAVRRLEAMLRHNDKTAEAKTAETVLSKLTDLCRQLDKQFCCSPEADDMEYKVMANLFNTTRA